MDVKLDTRKTLEAVKDVTHDIPSMNNQTKEAIQDVAFGSVCSVLCY